MKGWAIAAVAGAIGLIIGALAFAAADVVTAAPEPTTTRTAPPAPTTGRQAVPGIDGGFRLCDQAVLLYTVDVSGQRSDDIRWALPGGCDQQPDGSWAPDLDDPALAGTQVLPPR